MEHFNDPVDYVQGIGPAIAARLATVGISTVSDLLRVPELTILGAIADIRGIQDVRFWISCADLLQLEAMDADAAEALVLAEIDGADTLSETSIPDIRNSFVHALAQGRIPAIPSDDSIASMVRDSARVATGGTIDGATLDDAGLPIAGCHVRYGLTTTHSNLQGRFRLVGIPYGSRAALVLAADGHHPRHIDDIEVEAGTRVTAYRPFRLTALTANEEPYDPRLSEVTGDRLPELGDHDVREEFIEPAEIAEGELFDVFSAAADGAVLVSTLRSYQSGRFHFRLLRVAAGDAPADLQVSDRLRYRDGVLQLHAWTDLDAHKDRVRRRMIAQLGDFPVGISGPALTQELNQRIGYLHANGYMRTEMRDE